MSATSPPTEWSLLPPAPPGEVEGDDIPPIIAHVLYHRGLTRRVQIESFLSPTPASLHDPCLLPDMDQALSRLGRAIAEGETVGILGDFDVDGVSGTALLTSALRQLGGKVVPYIPHRVLEGHGPNPKAVQSLAQKGCSVMITVDCGVTSPEEVGLAKALGMDTIITDHHTPRPPLPPAHAVINPKVPGGRYPFLSLSGAGLAFKLAQALYQHIGQPLDPHLMSLAAIGTLADISPLVGENRYLVKEGIRRLASTRSSGMLALCRRAGITPKEIDTEAISFAIAPRLNAAGRLDHALTSLHLLTTGSEEEASALADELEDLNQQRRQLTEEAMAAAREEVLAREPIPAILLVGRSWYIPGIVGLVASRLVEEFHRPAVVMCLEDEMVRASARSIPQFSVVSAFTKCQDLFAKFGGHPQAAGFTMPRQNIGQLTERLEELAFRELANVELQPKLDIDAEVSPASLAGEAFRWVKMLEPYGQENPPPIFLTRGLHVANARLVGERGQHLSLNLKEGGIVFDAIAFRMGDRWMEGINSIDVVYTLGTRRRGNTEVMSLRVLDFRPSSVQ